MWAICKPITVTHFQCLRVVEFDTIHALITDKRAIASYQDHVI